MHNHELKKEDDELVVIALENEQVHIHWNEEKLLENPKILSLVLKIVPHLEDKFKRG